MTTPLDFDQYAADEMLAPSPCSCPTVALQWAAPAGPGMVTVEGEEVPAPAGASGPGWLLQVGTQRAPLGGDVSWPDVAGKPATFPPSPHTHGWADVTGKPTTFPPSTHSHTMAQVTGLSAALDAIPKQAKGRFTFTSASAVANGGTVWSGDFVFPSGLFSGAPDYVDVAIIAASVDRRRWTPQVISVTSTGASVMVVNHSPQATAAGLSTTVMWHAVA